MEIKQWYLLIIMSITGLNSFASDIAVKNADGITIHYNYINDGKDLEVIGADVPKYGTLVIPADVTYMNRSRKVTSIIEQAFKNSGLSSIIIPQSIIKIGTKIFYGCKELTSVIIDDKNPIYDSRQSCNAIVRTSDNTLLLGCKNTVIPNDVDSIGDRAFEDCDGLASIILPDNIKSIGKNAFYRCVNLERIDIGNNVTYIGPSAFMLCSHLRTVSIGNSVTFIGDLAFSDCTILSSIVIPNSVVEISGSAFYGCKNLESVILGDNVISIEWSLFQGCSNLKSVKIGEKVKSIGARAFSGCSKLSSLEIPNSVDSIESFAFENCNGLKSLYIGNGVRYIGFDAFKECTGLTSINISDIEAWCKIDFVGFAYKNDHNYKTISLTSNPLYYAKHLYINNEELKDLVIPNSITTIYSNAFIRCESIKSLTIPYGVKSIQGNAFYGCSNLTSINISNSVKSIGDAAFRYCGNIVSFTIPSSVTNIGNNIISNCSKLTTLTIPNSVVSIAKEAFNFTDLTTVIALFENPPAITGKSAGKFGTFSPDTYNNATLYVPVGTIDKYKHTNGWGSFVFIEEGTPSIIRSIEDDQLNEIDRYNLEGKSIKELKRGVNIIRTKDGKTKKVLMK